MLSSDHQPIPQCFAKRHKRVLRQFSVFNPLNVAQHALNFVRARSAGRRHQKGWLARQVSNITQNITLSEVLHSHPALTHLRF